MNILAHLYLADRTRTSAAGQILGDMVKGPLDGRYPAEVEHGIALHRRIDSFTDWHPITTDLRRRFEPPLRRYAGILVDIGFDYCLASNWRGHSTITLEHFAPAAVARVQRQWPAQAPIPASRLNGLGAVLVAYRRPAGIQRALDSVGRRLKRDDPLGGALPRLLDEQAYLAAGFEQFFPELCHYVEEQAKELEPLQ